MKRARSLGRSRSPRRRHHVLPSDETVQALPPLHAPFEHRHVQWADNEEWECTTPPTAATNNMNGWQGVYEAARNKKD